MAFLVDPMGNDLTDAKEAFFFSKGGLWLVLLGPEFKILSQKNIFLLSLSGVDVISRPN